MGILSPIPGEWKTNFDLFPKPVVPNLDRLGLGAGAESFDSKASSRHDSDPGRELKSLRFTSTGAVVLRMAASGLSMSCLRIALCTHRPGAGPIVPPSMNSALIKLRFTTCFPAAIWLAHRIT